MSDDMTTPCYVISSNGFKDRVSYQDDWCYGRSEYIGAEDDRRTARDVIKLDIRAHWNERNGIPIYFVSDHGNVHRSRAIRLRTR
jgi:hypothetical protein